MKETITEMVRRIIKEEIEQAQITNIKRNIMGTISFDLKTKNMRKLQSFSVYPITEPSNKVEIQSNARFGYILFDKDALIISAKNRTYANSWTFQADEKIVIKLSSSQMEQLKTAIKGTSGDSVGTSFVKSNNSGASKL